MTRALVFAGEEALVAALRASLVPAPVQARPAVAWTDADGALWIVPEEPIGAELATALAAAGVRLGDATPPAQGARRARIWPELVAPRRDPGDPELPSRTVLFAVEAADASAPEQALLGLLAELLRLGCDRVSYALVGAERGVDHAIMALVQAVDPPYYTVAACAERERMRAFVPLAGARARTWIELGYSHPLAAAVAPPAGLLTLLRGDGVWLEPADGPWRDLFELVELTLPRPARPHEPVALPGPLRVPLRLAPAQRDEPPSLWLLTGEHGRDAVACVDALARALPESVIGRLRYAVLDGDDGRVAVLRARAGRAGPPEIDVAGTAMVPLAGIDNLYVPRDAAVEPPLGRDRLRALLAPESDRVYWLAPHGARGFRAASAPESAFAPLADWVEYVIHASAGALEPWVRAVSLELEPFQSTGEDAPEARDTAEARRTRRPAATLTPAATPADAPEPAPAPAHAHAASAHAAPAHADAPAQGPVIAGAEAELVALEQAFLALDEPADAPARLAMWQDMARLLYQLGRPREASLCLVRAIWELPRDQSRELVLEWARAEREAAGVTRPGELAWLPLTGARDPAADLVRAVAVQWIAVGLAGEDIGGPAPGSPGSPGSPSSIGRDLPALQRFFDRHDRTLDVRTLWLVRWALADLVGGDPLGLARTRDRILQSLGQGLSLGRDVPPFLRFLGSGSGDSVAMARLADRVEALLELFDSARRRRETFEAPTALTRAYVGLVVAYGLARLGRPGRALELRDEATQRLDLDDPVHGYLVRAYAARIDQALEGLPPEAPLPADLVARLTSIGHGRDQLARYKVDRLRQASRILEPHARIDAMHGFLRRLRQDDDELARLRSLGAAELAREVARLVAAACEPDVADRARLCDQLLDLLPALPDAQAVPALRRLLGPVLDLAPPTRALLLEKALLLAGYFGRDEMAADIARSLVALVAELGADEAEALAANLAASLRSLRRVGLRDHAARLIEAVGARITGDGVQALEARLHLAAGLAFLGLHAQAAPILDHARRALDSGDIRIVDQRVRLARALAQALGEHPRDQALDGLSALGRHLAGVTDSYNTNTHFCLSVIAFMEALVLGHARTDLALGELGRRWLDDDEHLVRRRIHRELGERA